MKYINRDSETGNISGFTLTDNGEPLDESSQEWVDYENRGPSIDDQIAGLEDLVTKRWLRGAALGDDYSIDKIQIIEDQIEALRNG